MLKLPFLNFIIIYICYTSSYIRKQIYNIHHKGYILNNRVIRSSSPLFSSTSDTIANLITQTKGFEVEAIKCIENAENSKELELFRVLYLGFIIDIIIIIIN